MAFSKSSLLPAGQTVEALLALAGLCVQWMLKLVVESLQRAHWVWSMSVRKRVWNSFCWTISEDWVVALGRFSYFLALITFSGTQLQCTGILLAIDVASITEQESPRPTASRVQGSSSVSHFSGCPVLFSVILSAVFQIFVSLPHLSHLLGLAAACSIVGKSQLPSKQ